MIDEMERVGFAAAAPGARNLNGAGVATGRGGRPVRFLTYLALLLALTWSTNLGAVSGTRFRLPAENVPAQVVIEAPAAADRGVLVLAAGKEAFTRTLAADDPWRQFAEENRFALVSVAVGDEKMAKDKLPPPRSSDMVVKVKDAETLLAQALKLSRLEDRPIYLYGTREGADLVLRAVEGKIPNISAWAVHGASAFPAPARETPYGIVAAADLDGLSFDAARWYAEGLRIRGAQSAWISLPGVFKERVDLEELVRRSFAAMTNPNRVPVLVHNRRKEAIKFREGAGATSVLPAADLIKMWSDLHQPNPVITKTIQTGIKEFPEMTFALRLPSKGGPRPRILAYSYWHEDVGSVLKKARDDTFFWNRYAEKRGLAVVTWNVKSLWSNLRSFDQINNREIVKQRRILDDVAREWNRGIRELARAHGIADRGILLYGCSRGANFAVRLATRDPDLLSAVVAHIANSFERPSPVVSNVVWAITNGEMDQGAPNAKRFYDQCRALGLPVFLRFFPGLGHDENDESRTFAQRFFDYVMSAEIPGRSLAAELVKTLKTPGHVADLTNYLVVDAAREEEVPPEQRIAIPDQKMAELWGRVLGSPSKPRTKAAEGQREIAKVNSALENDRNPDNQPNLLTVAASSAASGTNVPPAKKISVIQGDFGTATLIYDANHRLESIAYSDGSVTTYKYSEKGGIESSRKSAE